MKPIKDPFMTTIRNLKSTSGTQTRETLRKIEEKIIMYGLCSDSEYEFLQRFGKNSQKEAIWPQLFCYTHNYYYKQD